MTNYDFTLEDKSKKSKNKSKSNNLSLECIDGFVEDQSKNSLFEKLPPPIEIPPGTRILIIYFHKNTEHIIFLFLNLLY